MISMLLWLAGFAVAAVPDAGDVVYRRYAWEHYSIRNGLPTNLIKHVYPAPDGRIWVSTDFGLVMLEGPTMEVYRDGLRSPAVKQVLGLEDGRLLVVTPRDLLVWDRNRPFSEAKPLMPLRDGENLAVETPVRAEQAPDGAVWIAAADGVARWHHGVLQFFVLPQDSRSKSYYRGYQFAFLKNGLVLISAQTGRFFLWDGSLIEPVALDVPGYTSTTVDALAVMSEGRILAAGESGVFEVKLNGRSAAAERIAALTGVVSLLPVSRTQFWAGTKVQGALAYRMEASGWAVADSLQRMNRIKDLKRDNDGNLWAATDDGVFCYYPRKFVPVPFEGEDTFVNALAVQSPSRVLAVTRNHAVEITAFRSGVSSRPVLDQPGLTFSHASVYRDTAFIGLLNGGFLVHPGRSGDPERGWFSLPGPVKRVMAGDLIALAAENQPHLYIAARGMPPDTLKLDSEGVGGALFRSDPRSGRFLTAVSGRTPAVLVHAMKDRRLLERHEIPLPPGTDALIMGDLELGGNGSWWVSTHSGIGVFEPSGPSTRAFRWIVFPVQFPFHLVRDILVDLEGKLWMAAEHGLFVYYDGALSRFDNASGLLADMVTAIKSTDRVLVAGHSGGVSVLADGISFPRTRVNPYVRSAGGKPVGMSEKSFLLPEGDEVQVHAIAASYPAREMRLQFRINEEPWLDADPFGQFEVSGLRAGEHVLEIRAIRSGFEPGIPRSYVLIVEPVWYRTWPAFAAELLLALILVITGVRFRSAVIERRRALESLQQTRERIQTVVANTPVLLFALDQDGKITLLEGKALNSMHLQPEQWVGRPASDLFSDWLFTTCVEAALKGTESTVIVDRNSRAYDVHLIPLPQPDGSFHVNGVGVDITDQVMTERKLRLASEEAERARDAAERANLAKSQFLANMSHELRTPLNAIIGYAQVLDKEPGINPRQLQFIKTMRESGYHLLGMINDILDLSKIESGQMDVSEHTLTVRTFVQDLEDMFKLQAESQGLLFELQVEPAVPPAVVTDSSKLRQIAINLISNAIKYTQSGRVRILVGTESNGERAMLKLAVEDSGRGIPADQLEEIFKPFKQVQGVFNKGTGLGLTIVRNLARLLGGTVSVESEVDHGSRFTVLIPLVEAREAEPRPADRLRYELRPGARLSIIVVDDVTSNRELLRELLEPLGVEVRLAGSGSQALKLLADRRPDVMLLDLNMPTLKGEEVLGIIRTQFAKDLPVIAVTAQGMQEHRDAALRIGFDAFVSKPFLMNDILEAIHIVTGGAFTREAGVEITGEVTLQDPSNLKHWFGALPAEARRSWLEALELTDLDQMEELMALHDAPMELQRCIRGRDYRSLFSIDELLRNA